MISELLLLLVHASLFLLHLPLGVLRQRLAGVRGGGGGGGGGGESGGGGGGGGGEGG